MLGDLAAVEAALDTSRTIVVYFGDQRREAYYIGTLAQVMGVTPGEIRSWVDRKILPETPFSLPGATPRGRRRIYLRQQIITVWETYQMYREIYPDMPLEETLLAEELGRYYRMLADYYRPKN